jgi:hypothetical protein
MDIYEKTQELWEKSRKDFERRVQGWVDNLMGKMEDVKKDRSLFRAWKPLEVYVSYSFINLGMFSIRFLGQEVARLKILNGEKTLIIEEKHKKHNVKFFGLEGFGAGKYRWEEAMQFRKHFKDLLNDGKRLKTGIEEHRLEWLFLQEMSKSSIKDKFVGKLAFIQPVKIAGCPFQMPLPIKGSSGMPEMGDGHIDILARRRSEHRKVVLSLWELKDVGKLAEAVRQAYIYSVTLLLMLRSTSGRKWHRIFGFHGELPEKLEVEYVVAVSKDQKPKMLKAAEEARDEMPLSVEEGEVKPYACYYEPPTKTGIPKSLSIESFEPLLT